jgi:3-polyprenyl-4-hydroxybenzoate decarboxylase
LTADKEEIMFQIEILYDFADDVKNLDDFVAEKISNNFGITREEAKRYVQEYKMTIR